MSERAAAIVRTPHLITHHCFVIRSKFPAQTNIARANEHCKGDFNGPLRRNDILRIGCLNSIFRPEPADHFMKSLVERFADIPVNTLYDLIGFSQPCLLR